MRVVQTPVRFAPAVGGVESHAYELSTRLADRGHEITVVCAATAEAPGRDVVDGVDVLRLRSPISIANTDVTPTLPARLVRRVRRADVVHTHLPTPWCADVSAAMARATGTASVLTYHNDIVGDGIAERVAQAYNATALRATLGLVDRILVTREGYVGESAHLGRYADKISTVPNGVDVDRFAPVDTAEERSSAPGFVPDAANVFFLSVLDEYHAYKGLPVLLRAMSALEDRVDRPVHLVVGGDGPLRESYEAMARDLGVADRVTFVGYVPDAALPAAYSAAEAFVLPSIDAAQEGFGLVALEALACETPVVTTDIVGVADDIDRLGVGRVVEPDDPVALAEGLATVLTSGPDASAGRELCVERYAWDAVVDQMRSVYDCVREGSG